MSFKLKFIIGVADVSKEKADQLVDCSEASISST